MVGTTVGGTKAEQKQAFFLDVEGQHGSEKPTTCSTDSAIMARVGAGCDLQLV